MPTTITGSDSYDVNITIPDDGDDEDALSVNDAFNGLANRTTNLKDHKADYVVASSKTQEFESGSTLLFDPGSAELYPDPQRPPDAATIMFDWSESPDLVLPSPGAVHVCKVLDASAIIPPQEGQRVMVRTVIGMGDGVAWKIEREDGTLVCLLGTDDVNFSGGGTAWSSLTTTMVGSAYSSTKKTWPAWVILQYEGGVWRGWIAGGFVQYCGGW